MYNVVASSLPCYVIVYPRTLDAPTDLACDTSLLHAIMLNAHLHHSYGFAERLIREGNQLHMCVREHFLARKFRPSNGLWLF